MATDQTSGRAVEASSSPQRPPTAAELRASEHAGTTDTEVLARDIEQTREELAVTIDAIVDRVSPKNVVARTKQRASEQVAEATEVVKERAGAAAEIVKEKAASATGAAKAKAATATEAAKSKAATVKEQAKDKVSGSSDSDPDRSPLTPATSVALGSASPVTPAPAPAPLEAAADQAVVSPEPVDDPATDVVPGPGAPTPLPPGTVSIDAGALPPPEPAASTGSLADAAEADGPRLEPAGAEATEGAMPASSSSSGSSSSGSSSSGSSSGLASALPSRDEALAPSLLPVYAGTGAATLVALLLLLLRRRRRR